MTRAATALRRAGPGDLETLIALVDEYCAEDRHPFDEARIRRALEPLLRDDRFGVVWVLGDPPSGYAVVTWGYSLESGGRDALLDEIYLRERGRGQGTAALQAILAELRARGLPRLFLETEAHNEGARRFYTRSGFTVEPSTWMSLSLVECSET